MTGDGFEWASVHDFAEPFGDHFMPAADRALAEARVASWRERGGRAQLLRRCPGGEWEEIAGPIVGPPHLAADDDERTPVERRWSLAGFWLRAGRRLRHIGAGRGTAGGRLRRWR
jgi:hypothetical protein